jgi:hypothetical protein
MVHLTPVPSEGEIERQKEAEAAAAFEREIAARIAAEREKREAELLI